MKQFEFRSRRIVRRWVAVGAVVAVGALLVGCGSEAGQRGDLTVPDPAPAPSKSSAQAAEAAESADALEAAAAEALAMAEAAMAAAALAQATSEGNQEAVAVAEAALAAAQAAADEARAQAATAQQEADEARDAAEAAQAEAAAAQEEAAAAQAEADQARSAAEAASAAAVVTAEAEEAAAAQAQAAQARSGAEAASAQAAAAPPAPPPVAEPPPPATTTPPRAAEAAIIDVTPDDMADAMADMGAPEEAMGATSESSPQRESAEEPLEPTPPEECWGCSSNIFEDYGVNPFVDTSADPLSTFALDVDTASYVVARNHLRGGVLPPPEAVRVEEFVNYFDGGYEPAWDEFVIDLAAAPTPFARDGYVLLRVGVQAPEALAGSSVLDTVVIVLDRSGSMSEMADFGDEPLERIQLAHKAVDVLLDGLPNGTRVGIVAYNQQVSTILEPTDVAGNRARIMQRVREQVIPEGRTNTEAGLLRGFEMAVAEADAGRSVLVLLLSDGVANVGATSTEEILNRIGERGDIGLSTIGVGLGPFNDVLMEQLANSADGTYHYIDTSEEARRIFDDNLGGMLLLAARDAKIQVEFNPETVHSYRLLGFENRDVADEDFRDNTVDAGEVGLGQSATALYELELRATRSAPAELATVTLRYERPDRTSVREIDRSIRRGDVAGSFAAADPQFRLAAVAAEFAEVLRRSPFVDYRDLDMTALLEESRAVARDLPGDSDATELADLIETARQRFG